MTVQKYLNYLVIETKEKLRLYYFYFFVLLTDDEILNIFILFIILFIYIISEIRSSGA